MGVLVVLAIFAFLFASSLAAGPTSSVVPAARPAIVTASGIRFETLKPGIGPSPIVGDAVRLVYVGRLEDGTVFDRPDAPVTLPVAGLLPGFTEALLLMSTGGIYHFRIPPRLAYGAQGAGGVIPPNAALIFRVFLTEIERAAAPAPALPR